MTPDDAPLPSLRPHTLGRWAAATVLLVAACCGACAWLLWMPGTSYDQTPPPPSPEDRDLALRLRRHVDRLGATSTATPGQRSFHDGDLEVAERLVTNTLVELGYEPTRDVYSISGTEVANVEVSITGARLPAEVIVVGAHYDSVGHTHGADDNASGVAALLELARELRGVRRARTIRLVAFANEEPPHFQTERMGSLVYARRAHARGDDVVAMISLECLGYYRTEPKTQDYPPPFAAFHPDRGDFIAFVSDLSSRGLLRRALGTFRRAATIPSEGLAAPSFVPGVGWSDHWSFWQVDYPAIMVTDTALFRNPHYHGLADTAETLDYERMARVVRGVEAVIADLADGPRR